MRVRAAWRLSQKTQKHVQQVERRVQRLRELLQQAFGQAKKEQAEATPAPAPAQGRARNRIRLPLSEVRPWPWALLRRSPFDLQVALRTRVGQPPLGGVQTVAGSTSVKKKKKKQRQAGEPALRGRAAMQLRRARVAAASSRMIPSGRGP